MGYKKKGRRSSRREEERGKAVLEERWKLEWERCWVEEERNGWRRVRIGGKQKEKRIGRCERKEKVGVREGMKNEERFGRGRD